MSTIIICLSHMQNHTNDGKWLPPHNDESYMWQCFITCTQCFPKKSILRTEALRKNIGGQWKHDCCKGKNCVTKLTKHIVKMTFLAYGNVSGKGLLWKTSETTNIIWPVMFLDCHEWKTINIVVFLAPLCVKNNKAHTRKKTSSQPKKSN